MATRSAEARERERRTVEELRKRLSDALALPVPKSHSTWSYQRTIAFKEAVSKARALVKSERAASGALRGAIGTLMDFHQ